MGKTPEQIDKAFGDFSGQEELEVMREVVGTTAVFNKQDLV